MIKLIKNQREEEKRRRREYRKFIRSCKVEWHKATPRKFDCKPRCMVCCEQTYYLPQEVRNLPNSIVDHLRMTCLQCGTDHHYYEKRRVCYSCGYSTCVAPLPFDEESDFGCFFFDITSFGKHCTIYEYRPLRCRLFPYIPLIRTDLKKIIIVAEDFVPSIIHPKKRERTFKTEDWRRCYGLGLGESVNEKEIEANSVKFLLMLASASGYKQLFERLLVKSIPISSYELAMHRKTVHLMESGDDLTRYFTPNPKWRKRKPFRFPT